MLTIPFLDFVVPSSLPQRLQWIRGQQEIGDSGYHHWQLLVAFRQKTSVIGVRSWFGPFHAELTRSSAAADYVWKENTRVEGSQFELGALPISRNSRVDWELIWEHAKNLRIESIPASIRIQSYRSLRQIGTDYAQPLGIERRVFVFHGSTGTGKSRRAWEEAGQDAYPKDPRSKFWCGYSHQEHVVIDEFRGGIDIAHFLRWTDRYPVIVEVKGGAVVLKAKTIWITSNLSPQQWFPEIDVMTQDALMRRLTVVDFDNA